MLVYPWFTIPATIIVCAFLVGRRQRPRAAIAARADYEHRELMVRAIFNPEPPPVEPQRRPRAAVRSRSLVAYKANSAENVT